MDEHTTFFSTREWAECWSGVFSTDQPLEISVVGSGPPRTMHFIKKRLSYGLYNLSSGHFHDFCLSPGWVDELEDSTVSRIIDRIPWARTKSLTWIVRFDHIPLASSLLARDFPYSRIPVAILDIETDYERVFRAYSATIRNQIRKSVRRGISVRNTS